MLGSLPLLVKTLVIGHTLRRGIKAYDFARWLSRQIQGLIFQASLDREGEGV